MEVLYSIGLVEIHGELIGEKMDFLKFRKVLIILELNKIVHGLYLKIHGLRILE
jgi:hypothetical protein